MIEADLIEEQTKLALRLANPLAQTIRSLAHEKCNSLLAD